MQSVIKEFTCSAFPSVLCRLFEVYKRLDATVVPPKFQRRFYEYIHRPAFPSPMVAKRLPSELHWQGATVFLILL